MFMHAEAIWISEGMDDYGEGWMRPHSSQPLPPPNPSRESALSLPREMPYSVPEVRRTRSSTTSFSDERGPGAFVSLGSLPRRKSPAPAPPGRKSPVFHLNHDDDDHSSSPDSLDEHTRPTLSISISGGDKSTPPQNASGSLQLPAAVPFPRSTSPSSPQGSSSTSSGSSSPRPPITRGSSTPIFLSNGKPLKSSLKSSASSPSIAMSPEGHSHLRSRSEPSTPALPHKNVHFPDQEGGLATVRVFSRSARPAALSNPGNTKDDETETEGEEIPPNRFPFPTSTSVPHPYEIDTAKSTMVPSSRASPYANLHLESLQFSPSSSSSSGVGVKPHLSGSIIVRNLAFEKHVAVRFTLDDWQTVSEVSAHFVESIPSLPPHITQSSAGPSRTTVGDLVGPAPQEKGWDRFSFNIRLEDYAYALSTRVIWLAARYRVHSTYPDAGCAIPGPGGEWWDNNGGSNYRVSFRPLISANSFSSSRPRRETTPAPIIPPLTTAPTPPTYREHALGLFIPSEKFPSANKVSPPTSPPGNSDEEKLPTPFHSGKLNLSNYAPPHPHTPSNSPAPSTLSGLLPIKRSSARPVSTITQRPHLLVPNHDEDSASPASSTLSTPSVSPTTVPHVLIGGMPATSPYFYAAREREPDFTPRPGHLEDWEWSAPGAPPSLSIPGLPNVGHFPGAQGLTSDSLYKAFVTQWCFAGPSPSHVYGVDGGVLA
ncbi:carbohydrate-binding module family 21 protein [Hydnomerulius pinastri MD-312]|nr:carbohydrate-binding module family 21 protein [Hydnomerulius pinastri MD-312]